MSPNPPRARLLRRAVAVVLAVVLVAYPVLVWVGLSTGSARHTALWLLVAVAPAAALRLTRARRREVRGLALLPLVTVAMLGLAAWLDDRGLVLAVPVAINALLLLTFGWTLRRGAMPMVERFARLQLDDPTPAQLAWCRLWTWIWCGFFVWNIVVATVLAVAAPLAWWATYNGLISYVLMGGLFATEFLMRRRRFPTDGAARR